MVGVVVVGRVWCGECCKSRKDINKMEERWIDETSRRNVHIRPVLYICRTKILTLPALYGIRNGQ
jgi:hypothetical protein